MKGQFATSLNATQIRARRIKYLQCALLLCVLLMPLASFAASQGSTGGIDTGGFQNIYDWLKSIVLGTGGRLVALAVFFVGMTWSIVKQTAMPAVVSIGCALLLAFIPGMIESILPAVIL